MFKKMTLFGSIWFEIELILNGVIKLVEHAMYLQFEILKLFGIYHVVKGLQLNLQQNN